MTLQSAGLSEKEYAVVLRGVSCSSPCSSASRVDDQNSVVRYGRIRNERAAIQNQGQTGIALWRTEGSRTEWVCSITDTASHEHYVVYAGILIE